MIKDLKDKVTIVTRAGSGIGRLLALGFAKEKMKIVIVETKVISELQTYLKDGISAIEGEIEAQLPISKSNDCYDFSLPKRG